jgi:hypothetical protein
MCVDQASSLRLEHSDPGDICKRGGEREAAPQRIVKQSGTNTSTKTQRGERRYYGIDFMNKAEKKVQII